MKKINKRKEKRENWKGKREKREKRKEKREKRKEKREKRKEKREKRKEKRFGLVPEKKCCTSLMNLTFFLLTGKESHKKSAFLLRVSHSFECSKAR